MHFRTIRSKRALWWPRVKARAAACKLIPATRPLFDAEEGALGQAGDVVADCRGDGGSGGKAAASRIGLLRGTSPRLRELTDEDALAAAEDLLDLLRHLPAREDHGWGW